MNADMTPVEARILGCLIEKQHTTPEYYPLTLNALTSACNQKSNRSPVLTFEETLVVRGLDRLQDRKLVVCTHTAGGRVPKYRQVLTERLSLDDRELVLLCELLIRGPQTVGELRSHSARMADVGDLEGVEEILRELTTRDTPPIVLLPRQPGRKEPRYAHLLCGEPDLPEATATATPEPARQAVVAENERLDALEVEIQSMRAELIALRTQFERLAAELE